MVLIYLFGLLIVVLLLGRDEELRPLQLLVALMGGGAIAQYKRNEARKRVRELQEEEEDEDDEDDQERRR